MHASSGRHVCVGVYTKCVCKIAVAPDGPNRRRRVASTARWHVYGFFFPWLAQKSKPKETTYTKQKTRGRKMMMTEVSQTKYIDRGGGDKRGEWGYTKKSGSKWVEKGRGKWKIRDWQVMHFLSKREKQTKRLWQEVEHCDGKREWESQRDGVSGKNNKQWRTLHIQQLMNMQHLKAHHRWK